MNESETRAEYVDPKLKETGWGEKVNITSSTLWGGQLVATRETIQPIRYGVYPIRYSEQSNGVNPVRYTII